MHDIYHLLNSVQNEIFTENTTVLACVLLSYTVNSRISELPVGYLRVNSRRSEVFNTY